MSDISAVLFADDVLFTANTPQGLQSLVDIAIQWAEQRDMTWNTKRGKTEVLESRETRHKRSSWPEKFLQQVPEVTYLGVSLSEHGITGTKLVI